MGETISRDVVDRIAGLIRSTMETVDKYRRVVAEFQASVSHIVQHPLPEPQRTAYAALKHELQHYHDDLTRLDADFRTLLAQPREDQIILLEVAGQLLGKTATFLETIRNDDRYRLE